MAGGAPAGFAGIEDAEIQRAFGISRSLAEQHGGTLSLRPREGRECVAALVLPRPAAQAPRAGRAE
jgi:hypothetical protein